MRQNKTLTPEERKERLRAAHQQLAESVERLMTAEGWQAAMQRRAWMRRYSFRNFMLILQQCPDATDVRSLREWNAAGRHVRKGEHAIRIWAPSIRKQDLTAGPNDVGGDEADHDGDNQVTVRFFLVSVFDVSQTEGTPLPRTALVDYCPELLSGDAPGGLWDALAAQVRAHGFIIERGDCGRANGRTTWGETRTVRVRDDVDGAQAAKTLAHELAHIELGHEHQSGTRRVREVEAESVACIVATACGLDTLPYSVKYVAGWARDLDTATRSAERIYQAADTILTRLGVPAPGTELPAARPSAGKTAA